MGTTDLTLAPRPAGPLVGAAGAAPIPLVDLAPQHDEIAVDVRRGWERVCRRGRFILGDEVAALEHELARWCGVRHCVAVGSGTDAIELALRAAGVAPGDRVAVPANSFVASAFAVVRAGAVPEFVDVDERTLLTRPDALRACLDRGVAAVLPVHLHGQVCPLEPVRDDLDEHGTLVVEDAAQALGATRGGRKAGRFGVAAAVSFHPSKNLGAYGDGGAVLTDSGDVAAAVSMLRNHGERVRFVHPEVGANSRLDELQAVVLRAKLRRLDRWNAQRRAAAARYRSLLGGLDGVTLPALAAGNVGVWHLFVVRVAHRDRVRELLAAAGVATGVHYPTPIHAQPPFRRAGHGGARCPVAEGVAPTLLSLPLFPGITAAQQERVAEELGRALATARRETAGRREGGSAR